MNGVDSTISGFLLVLCASPFIKFATILAFFRFGLGFRGFTFGIATGVLSFLLALAILSSQLPEARFEPFEPSTWRVSDAETLRPHLEKRLDPGVMSSLKERFPVAREGEKLPMNVLLGGFILSELRRAFEIGILIIVPFLVIDIIVANALVLLSLTQLSVATVAVPIKLILFFSIDGWRLLTERLLGG